MLLMILIVLVTLDTFHDSADSFDDFAEFDPLTTIMIMITNATLTLFDPGVHICPHPAQRGIPIKIDGWKF